MFIRDVIPTNYNQKLNPEELLPYNEAYYKKCLLELDSLSESKPQAFKLEIAQLVLLQIKEAQLDGKRADEEFGVDHRLFVEKVIYKRNKLRPINIIKDRFQFPLYAFSLYLVAYAFFAFLLGAWYGHSFSETMVIPIPFSLLGVLLNFFVLVFAYVYLFYQRQKAKLLYRTSKQFTTYRDYISYSLIVVSFLAAYGLLRLRLTLYHLPLWQVLLIGSVGVILAWRRFVTTKTLPL